MFAKSVANELANFWSEKENGKNARDIRNVRTIFALRFANDKRGKIVDRRL